MVALPEPDWYFQNVLAYATPGTSRLALPGPAGRWGEWWVQRASVSPELTELLHSQGFVATAVQLQRLGVSEQRRRTRVSRGEWYRVGRGLIAPIDIRDDDEPLSRRRRHALKAAGAALTRPGHAVSGRSGAILHGLPVFGLPALPEITDRRQNGLGRWAMSHVHGATLTDDDVCEWFGIAVTRPPRTLVDLARHDRRDAIMAADAALRERLVSQAEIDRALAQARGWPGVRQAREVLALADPRAESPLESLARLVLHDDGFPPPELQVLIGGDRVDMLFEKQRLILEIDGLGKYRRTTLAAEKRRERRLRRFGYRVERLTWDELIRDWPITRQWLRPLFGLPV